MTFSFDALENSILKIVSEKSIRTPNSSFSSFVELSPLLDKLLSRQPPLKTTQISKSIRLQKFKIWLQSNNISVDFLDLKHADGMGLGVFSTRDMKQNDVFTCIPLALMLHSGNIRPDIVQFISNEKLFELIPSLILTFQLMVETLDLNSSFAAYINTLPYDFELPLFYNISQIELLKGSHVQFDAIQEIANNARQYLHFKRALSLNPIIPISDFTFAFFSWAKAIVMTRQNKIPDKSGNYNMALIPLYDLTNHKAGPINSFYNMDYERIESFLYQDVKAGDQIFMSYGSRSNSELLLYSGFVDTDNLQNDYVKIWIGFADKMTPQKERFMEKHEFPKAGFFTINRQFPTNHSDLLFYLAIVFSTKEEFEALSDPLKVYKPFSGISPNDISPELKIRIFEWLKNRFQIMLRTIPNHPSMPTKNSNIFKLRETEKFLYEDLSRLMT